MILKIQTLYLFLIFVLTSLLFMQNPIVNELSFNYQNDTYQEFTQIWSSAYIIPGNSRPYWQTNYVHLALILLIILCTVSAIFIPRKQKLQWYLVLITFFSSLGLLLSLIFSYRFRQKELGINLIEAIETPHLLWFALLFAFELSVLRFLRLDLKLLSR